MVVHNSYPINAVHCFLINLMIIDAISKSDHKITGEISCGTQYHFHMETHVRFNIFY